MSKNITRQKDITTINTKYVDVLDGIRAFTILIIMAFHFWQQSWIFNLETPWLSFLGIDNISVYDLVSTGYELVDLMILLSAFCLFLPYARAMVNGGKNIDSIKTFYKKRMARIFPSYYFCIIVLFVYSVATGAYYSTEIMWKDLLSHLTFTHMSSYETYTNTNLNVVLWTMAIEVMFYIIFPMLARAFMKSPIITYIVMVAASLGYVHVYVLGVRVADISLLVNSFPSFLSVFANGMMTAYIFVLLAKKMKHNNITKTIFSVLTIALIIAYCFIIINYLAPLSPLNGDESKIWQIKYRYPLSFLFAILILAIALSAKWIKIIFANPFTKFMAGISMNLYIWHQWISVFMKYDLRLPYWSGETPPNELGDTRWQYEYLILIILVSISVAIITTYLIEKPCADLILKKKRLKLFEKNQRKWNI